MMNRLARRISAVAVAGGLMVGATAGESLAQTPVGAGSETKVNTYITGFQGAPSVAMAADGSFLVVWTSGVFSVEASQDGSQEGVFAKLYNANGVAQSVSDIPVNTLTANSQNQPSVTVDAAGNYVVAFAAEPADAFFAAQDIYVRRFNAAGVAQDVVEVLANTHTTGPQIAPAVAADAAGNFVVVWESFGQEAPANPSSGIFGRRFSSAGAPLGGEFLVNTFTTSVQSEPAVARDADGDFVVVWLDYSGANPVAGGNFAVGIIGRRYNAAGVAQGGEFLVNTTRAVRDLPAIAMDAAGNFAVAWQSDDDGSGESISAQLFNAAGQMQGTEIRVVNNTTAGDQTRPSISFDSTGAFLITWQSANQDGSGTGVFGQRFNAAGAKIGTEFPVNPTTSGDQGDPAVAAGNGRAVVAWQGPGPGDGSETGVFMQRFTLGNPEPPGAIQFSAATYSVAENAGPATITVTRTGGSGGSISASYATSNGTATAGSDYTAASGTITFGDTDTAAKTFTVAITPDTDVEPDQTVNLALTNPTGGATLGSPNPAVLTIINDDVPPPPGGEFRVNAYTTSDQDNVRLAADGLGNFVVTWLSFAQDGDREGLFAQRYTNAGVPQGPEFRVNTVTVNVQRFNDVAADANGNFVVAWMDQSQDTGALQDQAKAQRFNAAGLPQGGELTVNTYTTGDQGQTNVAMNTDGNFVVVWASAGQDGSALGIFGQRFNAAGLPQGPEFAVNTYTPGVQDDPVVAMNPTGNFVVVWEATFGPNDELLGLFAQRYNAAGVAQGSEFHVNAYTTGSQDEPAIAMDAAGNFVVVWCDRNRGVFGRRFSSTGVALGSDFPVAEGASQCDPSIAMTAAGHFIIAWTDPVDAPTPNVIRARFYRSDGLAVGVPFQVNTNTATDKQSASVGMDPSGNALIAWVSDGQDGSGSGVYARRFDAPVVPPPPPSGQLQFSAATYPFLEPDPPLVVTVTRTGGSAGTVTVNYATSGGTAKSGEDFRGGVGHAHVCRRGDVPDVLCADPRRQPGRAGRGRGVHA